MAGMSDDGKVEVDPAVLDIAVDETADVNQDIEMLDADGPAEAVDEAEEGDDTTQSNNEAGSSAAPGYAPSSASLCRIWHPVSSCRTDDAAAPPARLPRS